MPKIKSVRCAVYECVNFDLCDNPVGSGYKFSLRVYDFI